MHKNRIIIALGILIILMQESGFEHSTKTFSILVFAALIVVLAFMIERKGFFSLQWRKKSTVTPVAKTYIEHNGTTVAATTPEAPIK